MKNLKRMGFSLTLVLTFTLLLCSCNEECPPCNEEKPLVEAPTQIVEVNQAKIMYNNYENRRVPLIQRYEDSINRRRKGYNKKKLMKVQQNRKAGEAQDEGNPKPFDVARYVHYDYETIKQYLAYIEQEAKAADVEISTIRFYLSNNSDETFYPNTKDSILHPRQNSFLISPTIKKGKRDFLFYIDDTVEDDPRAVLLNDDFGPAPKGVGDVYAQNSRSYASLVPILISSNATTTSLPFQEGKSVTMNRGHGAPPPYTIQ